MADDQAGPAGPDLTQGIALAELDDGGKLLGHVGEEPVLLVRRGADIFAIGAFCTHYHGPLAEGLVVGDTVRCPWHHACFDLRTGEALHAPAFDPVDCWQVEQRDGKIFVREKRARTRAQRRAARSGAPNRIVIVGGGAAGFAAAEMLRRRDYQGDIVMLSSDDSPPVDRPNLSKDYLAGSAPEEWVPLRADSFYAEHAIDLRLGATVAGIDAGSREVALAGGEKIPFDRLLLATGAEPVRPSIPGARPSDVLVLRSLCGLPGDHRAREGGAAGGRARRELHRPRSRGRLARKEHRSPCRRAGGASDGARSWAPNSARSSARCTRSMASCSICKTRRARSKAER